MTELESLRERVGKATGPDRDLEWDIQQELFGIDAVGFHETPHYTASIDAALGLVERKLPGMGWELIAFDNREAGVQAVIGDDMADAPTAPLAILKALLSALAAKASSEEAA